MLINILRLCIVVSRLDFRSFYHFVPYLYLNFISRNNNISVYGNSKETAYSLLFPDIAHFVSAGVR